jgi:hypothetical protein
MAPEMPASGNAPALLGLVEQDRNREVAGVDAHDRREPDRLPDLLLGRAGRKRTLDVAARGQSIDPVLRPL